LTADEWKAADTLRDLYLELTPPSEGVSSYGLPPRGRDPPRKADRRAKYLTGIEIILDGDITQCLSRSNLATKWRFLDALVAAVGCTTDEGTACLTGGPRQSWWMQH
jgi:hypothetical protein